MASITLGGNPVETAGELPAVGTQAPPFTVATTDLSVLSLDDLKGQRVILNIFPSIDTGICAASTRYFNQAAANLENTKIICVSKDLPFAHKRFCGAEGIEDVISGSTFRDSSFSNNYHVDMTSGGMQGFMSRAVVVLNEDHQIVHTEQVPEIGQEPNYEAALGALK